VVVLGPRGRFQVSVVRAMPPDSESGPPARNERERGREGEGEKESGSEGGDTGRERARATLRERESHQQQSHVYNNGLLMATINYSRLYTLQQTHQRGQSLHRLRLPPSRSRRPAISRCGPPGPAAAPSRQAMAQPPPGPTRCPARSGTRPPPSRQAMAQQLRRGSSSCAKAAPRGARPLLPPLPAASPPRGARPGPPRN
jgi:hypothetical protein